jgi:hypothetical protein
LRNFGGDLRGGVRGRPARIKTAKALFGTQDRKSKGIEKNIVFKVACLTNPMGIKNSGIKKINPLDWRIEKV